MFLRIIMMCLFFFGFILFVSGQQKKLDSLLNVLEHYEKEDTIKAKLMHNIGVMAVLGRPKITLDMAKRIGIIGL